jgi:hypothetical protein
MPKREYKPGGVSEESKYGRKKAWCAKNGKWGWEVPEPKPWKKASDTKPAAAGK